MTQPQRQIVRQTFARIEPIAEIAADLFYNRLFEIDPTLRPMFKGDMKEQGRKLMSMLSMIVHGLDDFASVRPSVEHLGRRHRSYEVTPAQYETVGAALIWTLEQGLGESFTQEVRDAWIAAYGAIAGIMTAAAERQAQDVAEPVQSVG